MSFRDNVLLVGAPSIMRNKLSVKVCVHVSIFFCVGDLGDLESKSGVVVEIAAPKLSPNLYSRRR